MSKTEEKVTKKSRKNYQIAATSDLSVKNLLKNVRQKNILKTVSLSLSYSILICKLTHLAFPHR